jgi:DNA-binding MarR family transcriptional regulator
MSSTEDKAPSPLPPAIAERLGFLLGRSHLQLLSLVGPALDRPGFSGKHLGCLSVIAAEGPLTQQRLGERIGIDRTTMVALVDALEREGFVERRRDPEDRRAYALLATAKGRRWLERSTAKVLEAEREFLAPLSAGERDTLVSLLQRLLVREPAELVADPPVEVRPR